MAQETFFRSIHYLKITSMRHYRYILRKRLFFATSNQKSRTPTRTRIQTRANSARLSGDLCSTNNLQSCSLIAFLFLIMFNNDTTIEIDVKIGNESTPNTELSDRSHYLSSFENRFYAIFDNVEAYPYSNLHKEAKHRHGFSTTFTLDKTLMSQPRHRFNG